ncbi:Panacea domain-containing protein [Spirobacillus cienkowskii]|uniref:Panacea domain-containing protein n=1 Tax=Spirobacillus cienkowskii TaxID=495820 RepID=UPI0030D22F3D
MQKIDPIQLSKWIIHNLPETNCGLNELTHLKLQKLSYYCYGICIANNIDPHFEQFIFEAWKHGPVCRSIYNEFKVFSNKNILKSSINKPSIPFAKEIEQLLLKVLYLYGSLTPWKIRQQSHLEEPWKFAFESNNIIIDENKIKNTFINKFFNPKKERIYGPEYVFDLSSFELDGIPIIGFKSFDELVNTAKKIYFESP